MNTYHCTDGQGGELTITADSPRQAAQEYVDTGDWGSIHSTTWIDVRVTPCDGDTLDPDESQRITITLDPEEPECPKGKHDWQSPHSIVGGIRENPGVRGHGGGVIITEVCAHCGCYRVRDTWAQRSDTGEQGLESVEYREADDDSIRWVKRQRICRDDDGTAYIVEDGESRVYAIETDDGWILERQAEAGDESPERLSEHATEDDAMADLLDYVHI